MILLILSLIVGAITAYLVDKTLLTYKLFKRKAWIILLHLICVIGLTLMSYGANLNFRVVDANGGVMPTDMTVAAKYNIQPVDDSRHGNIYKKPRYPQYIDRYYFPLLAVLRKEIYSLGDLIRYLGIFLSFSPVISIARFYVMRKDITEE